MKHLLCLFLLLCTIPAFAAQPLKIGTLLIEDVVPFYVAQQENMYHAAGVEVELIPFLSALERDSALTAGAIDGAIDDPIGALLLDRGRGLLKITALCLGAKPNEGVFAILASPRSQLQSVEDLKGVEIAVSSATIIEYVTERLLAEQGFSGTEIRTIDVKKMPIRMQMLLAGNVQAATLPEPLASIALGKGARLLVSDANSTTSLSQTVIVFRQQVLAEKKAAVAAFFQAYDQAVSAINARPEQYRSLFVDKGRIPPDLAPTYPIPRYPAPAPFSRTLYAPVKDWLVSKHLLAADLDYEQMVATDFMTAAH